MPFIEYLPINRLVEVGICEPSQTLQYLFSFDPKIRKRIFLPGNPAGFEFGDPICEICFLWVAELQSFQLARDHSIDDFFTDARRGTSRRMTAVIHVTFFCLANEGIPA